jgi:hypothetical protein
VSERKFEKKRAEERKNDRRKGKKKVNERMMDFMSFKMCYFLTTLSVT